MLNILFPSLPYQRLVDPMWAEEMDTARHYGHTVGLFDAEQEKLHQAPNPNYPSLYRGWMLTGAEYQKLEALTPLLVPLAMYLASHWANGWYQAIAGFTPKSYFIPVEERSAILTLLRSHGRCFVKGLSKSFGTDSVVSSLAEYDHLLKKHAVDSAEALFVREFVKLSAAPEQRFFAVRGRVYGASGQPFPAELAPVLLALQSRWFYTIDVAYDLHGKPIIIEVGDGQVSDTKEWTVSALYENVVNLVAAVQEPER
ncbi:ATP-grasp domain-containing protein [Hymenobacter terrenus]|uniref:ATP-grasp domain-containing protein n=1 Tax=Hymenobacter terrenus TaxID=1629124 RepID=UPI0006196F6E|nr:ATP-grasp domain-containing protein [Hymenobacter terrenus]